MWILSLFDSETLPWTYSKLRWQVGNLKCSHLCFSIENIGKAQLCSPDTMQFSLVTPNIGKAQLWNTSHVLNPPNWWSGLSTGTLLYTYAHVIRMNCFAPHFLEKKSAISCTCANAELCNSHLFNSRLATSKMQPQESSLPSINVQGVLTIAVHKQKASATETFAWEIVIAPTIAPFTIYVRSRYVWPSHVLAPPSSFVDVVT